MTPDPRPNKNNGTKRKQQSQGKKRNPWPRKAANKAYANIIAVRPDNALSETTENQIAEYAQDVFGSTEFAPWLRVYTALRGEFLEGWLPDNYFKTLRERLDPHPKLGMIRTVARQLLPTDALPDLVTCVRGNWRDADGNPISPAQARALCFGSHDSVFLKSDESRRSKGTREITPSDFDALTPSGSDYFVLQRKIKQHPTFAEWTPACVHTIRLTTYKGIGAAAELRGGIMRVGRVATNVVLATSLIRLPIDTDTAKTADCGYTPEWTPITDHPDTQVPLGGKSIPNFQTLTQTILDLHDRLPHVALIGWDLAIDDTGHPAIMEWNSLHPDIKLAEAATGPHFADIAHMNALQ